MTSDSALGFFAAVYGVTITLLIALLAAWMRGVRGDLRALKQELASDLKGIVAKVDFDVLGRITRLEQEHLAMRGRIHEDLIPSWARATAELLVLRERIDSTRNGK